MRMRKEYQIVRDWDTATVTILPYTGDAVGGGGSPDHIIRTEDSIAITDETGVSLYEEF